MPDRITSQRVICSGGLNTSENFLLLSTQNPGMATSLINYETSLTGGYRRINGFVKIDNSFSEVTSAGVPAEGAVLGIWGFLNIAGTLDIYAARKSVGSAVYRIYKFTSGVGWAEQVTGITHVSTGVTKLRMIAFNQAGAQWIVWVDGINEATAYDGVSYYEMKSTNVGGTLSPGGDQIVDKPAYVDYFQSTVFLGGITGVETGIVSYSAPSSVLDWTAASGAGQLIPGFPLKGIRSFRDENFIFGETKISKAVPNVTAGFLLQPVTTDIGCIAPDSILEIGGDLIFLSSDGIRPIAGTDKIGDTDIGLLSQSIQNTINNAIVTYDLNSLVGFTIRGKTQFRYLLSDSTIAVASSYGLIGAVRTYAQNRQWEFGELRGIRASCAWSGYNATGDEKIYHGDYNGRVYEQENGSSMDGANITSTYTMPYLDFGDPMIRKLMRKLHLFVRSESAVTLDFSIKYDWDRTSVINPTNYQVTTSSATVTYDSGIKYDAVAATYGIPGQPVFSKSVQGSGYAVQCSIVTDGIFAPYTVQGVVFEYSTKGRQLSQV